MAAVQTYLSKDVCAALAAVGGGDAVTDAGFRDIAHTALDVITCDGTVSEAQLACTSPGGRAGGWVDISG